MTIKDAGKHNISLHDAIKAIENLAANDREWRMKAISLLQLVGDKDVDQEKLTKKCAEHALAGLNLN